MESKFFNGAEAKKHHLPFTPRFSTGTFSFMGRKNFPSSRSTQAIWPLMPAGHARGTASKDVQVRAADAVSGGAAGERAATPNPRCRHGRGSGETAVLHPAPAAGAAICRAPPAAPACLSCHGCALPGRARAAWRGPAPRSAPPVRTWRGC